MMQLYLFICTHPDQRAWATGLLLELNAEYIAQADTEPRYGLHPDHPLLTEPESGGAALRGEVWLVSGQALQVMDGIQELPRLSHRRPIGLPGFSQVVHGYFWNPEHEAVETAPVDGPVQWDDLR